MLNAVLLAPFHSYRSEGRIVTDLSQLKGLALNLAPNLFELHVGLPLEGVVDPHHVGLPLLAILEGGAIRRGESHGLGEIPVNSSERVKGGSAGRSSL